MIRLPDLYLNSRHIRGIYDVVYVEPLAEGLVVALAGWDSLMVVDTHGRPLRTVPIASRLRKAVPPNVAELFAADDADLVGLTTVMAGVWAMGVRSDGLVALIHADTELLDRGTRTMRTRSYLSLVDPVSGWQCVDAPLIESEGTPPLYHFRGDTLYVLVQGVDDQMHANLTLSKYVVSTDGCEN